MNSLWLIIVALASFSVAYRFYSAFLAARVAMLDDKRPTPAHRLKDGVDYHPIGRIVLFGQHFAAIAGPGPLIGPVLAAQWGYLPGFSWIIVGACLAGGVHDMIILWASVRQDGLSLARIARQNIGPLAGLAASLTTLFIIIYILAAIAVVVVNALNQSPWGMFTILVTIPAALLTGLWMNKIRPGRVGEATAIGVIIVLLGVVFGSPFAASSASRLLQFKYTTLAVILPVYACLVSVLPVWVLMCPRDYLSSYMKIGVMIVLAAGIFIAHPALQMPATTPFIAGGGPVVSGTVWPFVCIVIMCGALSGFHALIASGTTPKMLNRESDIRVIGYGAMVMEGMVAVTALVAACALQPGDYFAINVPQRTAVQQAKYAELLTTQLAANRWDLAPHDLATLESETRETLRGRTGGAVTLAVGMGKVFSSLPGMGTLMAYWYHFVIMFEALFILTLLETGTRVSRFVVQEMLAEHLPALAPAGRVNWGLNIFISVATCAAWGWLLYMGNLDTLWRMMGIANQLLATIALICGTSYILNHAKKKVYALCTALPLAFTIVTVGYASVLSIMGWWADIPNSDPAPAFQLRLMCIAGVAMVALTAVITIDAARGWWRALHGQTYKPERAAASAS